MFELNNYELHYITFVFNSPHYTTLPDPILSLEASLEFDVEASPNLDIGDTPDFANLQYNKNAINSIYNYAIINLRIHIYKFDIEIFISYERFGVNFIKKNQFDILKIEPPFK